MSKPQTAEAVKVIVRCRPLNSKEVEAKMQRYKKIIGRVQWGGEEVEIVKVYWHGW